jgi:hypothetical protein
MYTLKNPLCSLLFVGYSKDLELFAVVEVAEAIT